MGALYHPLQKHSCQNQGFLNETCASHHVNMTDNQLPAHGRTREIEDSHEFVVQHKHIGIEDDQINDLGDASTDLAFG